ncbi:hypothetical protein DFH09DRAFT_1085491 [Mycena vulgaris]|nr:hypothetical protein DFH09DRAFT_1085491 [Mycena vulgaris]
MKTSRLPIILTQQFPLISATKPPARLRAELSTGSMPFLSYIIEPSAGVVSAGSFAAHINPPTLLVFHPATPALQARASETLLGFSLAAASWVRLRVQGELYEGFVFVPSQPTNRITVKSFKIKGPENNLTVPGTTGTRVPSTTKHLQIQDEFLYPISFADTSAHKSEHLPEKEALLPGVGTHGRDVVVGEEDVDALAATAVERRAGTGEAGVGANKPGAT